MIPVWTETNNGYNFGNEIVLANNVGTKTPNESYRSLRIMEFGSPADWKNGQWQKYARESIHRDSNTFLYEDDFYRAENKWYWSDTEVNEWENLGFVVSSQDLTLKYSDTFVKPDTLGYVRTKLTPFVGFALVGLSYAFVHSLTPNQPVKIKMQNVCARFGSLRINTPDGYVLSNVNLTSKFFLLGDYSINDGYDFDNEVFYNDGRGWYNKTYTYPVKFTESDVDYYNFFVKQPDIIEQNYIYLIPGSYEFCLKYTITKGKDTATYQSYFTILLKGGVASHIVVNVPPLGTTISEGNSNDNGWVTVTPGEGEDENVDIEW